MKRSLFKNLQVVSFLAGLALLIYLIQKTGWAVLAEQIAAIGWGFIFIILLSGARNYLRAGSWYYAIDPRHRAVPLWSLNDVMLAGEAVKYLTASGPFLSEPMKASLVRRRVSLLHGSSSVVVENMIYYLSVFLFMACGLPFMSSLAALPPSVRAAGYAVFAVMMLGVIAAWFSVHRRWYAIAVAAEWFLRHTPLGRRERFVALAPHIRALEDEIYAFYEHRQRAFFLILTLNIAAHLLNIVEVYVILALMGFDANVAASFLIEVATKLINLVFFFVPTRAGVYESGNALVLEGLGLSAGAGVALALIRKIRAFVWAGYGLVVLALMALRREDQLEKITGDDG